MRIDGIFYIEFHPARHDNKCLSLEEKKNSFEEIKEQIKTGNKYCNVDYPIMECTVVSDFWNVVRQTKPTST